MLREWALSGVGSQQFVDGCVGVSILHDVVSANVNYYVTNVCDYVSGSLVWLLAARAGLAPPVSDGSYLVPDLHEYSGSMGAVFSAIQRSISDVALCSAAL